MIWGMCFWDALVNTSVRVAVNALVNDHANAGVNTIGNTVANARMRFVNAHIYAVPGNRHA